MKQEIIEFNKVLRGEEPANFHAGDIVKVHLKIKEGAKERVQVFEGLVIAVKGRQSSSLTITVRKVSHTVGVEMIVPVLSKNVQKIELIKKAKVRRSKLYYVRSLTPKQSRMKYKDMKEFVAAEKEAEAVDEKLNEEDIKAVEKDMEKEVAPKKKETAQKAEKAE
ncbi:MAG: 50S ribosomal protein L19 [Parcubacteria group bacterium]